MTTRTLDLDPTGTTGRSSVAGTGGMTVARNTQRISI